MDWVRVQTSLYTHPKAREVGAHALGLWVLALAWCGHQESDGFIPTAALEALPIKRGRGERLADSLVAGGFWEAVDDGYRFHDWADYQTQRDDDGQLMLLPDARRASAREARVTRATRASAPPAGSVARPTHGRERENERERDAPDAGVRHARGDGTSGPLPDGAPPPAADEPLTETELTALRHAEHDAAEQGERPGWLDGALAGVSRAAHRALVEHRTRMAEVPIPLPPPAPAEDDEILASMARVIPLPAAADGS